MSAFEHQDEFLTMPLRQEEYQTVRSMLHRLSGIELGEQKQTMVHRRLLSRVQYYDHDNFGDYLKYVDTDPDERQTFLELLTTNVTSFFREYAHFVDLANQMIPLRREANRKTQKLRIWSTACSTGEEVWSIAIVVAECMAAYPAWNLEILATDINHTVLEKAKSGVYPLASLDSVTPERRMTAFQRGTGQNSGYVRVRPELRKLVTFMPLNLVGDWPKMEPFDIIFCRNVAIYFDRETRLRLNERLLDLLPEGGYFVSGHSEALLQSGQRAKWLGNTIYQKVAPK